MAHKDVNNDASNEQVKFSNDLLDTKPNPYRGDLEDFYRNHSVTDETSCGFSGCRGSFLQKFANKKVYVLIYGITGACFNSSFAYFNGTISTIEKRFKIPSRNTGIISVANDISLMLVSIAITYYASKGHKPRWIAAGLLMLSAFSLIFALPHAIYGASDSLQFTKEYGIVPSSDELEMIRETENRKLLCNTNATMAVQCEVEEGNLGPQVIFFVAQLIAGVGAALYGTLGVTYMDDNVKRSKSPALLSLSFFIKMLGPACGYAMASFFLKLFVAPTLTPTIAVNDPRWIGAWWMGWVVIGIALAVGALVISLFPRTLPRAAARRDYLKLQQREKLYAMKEVLASDNEDENNEEKDTLPASFSDMIATLKRLLKNKALMSNHFAAVFYMFGFTPYWIFTPKYIESQYKQSASSANLYTGTVAFVFTAIGVLSSGLIVSKCKPSARQMAAWNVLVGALTTVGYLSYVFLGCSANDNTVVMNYGESSLATCNTNCHCDYVKYAPVCGDDYRTYISACHAGCTERIHADGLSNQTRFENCSCISSNVVVGTTSYGSATPGACPIDCSHEFYIFLGVMCFLKFLGSSGISTNFLVGVRCVAEKDKSMSMGIGMCLTSLFAFIPSPIIFGAILDSTCAVWGKTCTGSGNCWLYDGPTLRNWMNITASSSIAVATLFDLAVWYYVKDVVIFDKKKKPKTDAKAASDN